MGFNVKQYIKAIKKSNNTNLVCEYRQLNLARGRKGKISTTEIAHKTELIKQELNLRGFNKDEFGKFTLRRFGEFI